MIYFVNTIYSDYPYTSSIKALDYPYTSSIKAVDYPYYPYSHRIYRPLSLYYDYYWPLSSLNRYSSYWPSYYPSYRYLYYKYTLPSDRYYHLKGKTGFLDYPYSYSIKAVDYPYYPYSNRIYRPLSLYYDYYWPLSSLYRYTSYWSPYPYRYFYYKYTLPYKYYRFQRKIIYLRDPISQISQYRIYPTTSYLRHKIYKPLSLYCDYYDPIRSLFWDSSYWPLYKTTDSLAQQCGNGSGPRLQRIFDDETRLIRAQTASLLKRIHDPVPRVQRFSWPLSVTTKHYDDVPARLFNDNYIHRLLVTSPKSKTEYTTYYTEPVRKYIGSGHLACVSYAGDRGYLRRPHIYLYEDPLKNDIQLMSYYINKFKQEKAITGSNEQSKAEKADRYEYSEKSEKSEKTEYSVEEKPEITEITE